MGSKGLEKGVDFMQRDSRKVVQSRRWKQSLLRVFRAYSPGRALSVFPLRSDLLLLEGQFTYLQYFRKSYLSIMPTPILRGLPRWFSSKEPTCHCRRCRRCGFRPSVGNMPWRQVWQHTSVVLSGKFHGHRSVVGYSPWGCKESGMTEHTCKEASILLGAT